MKMSLSASPVLSSMAAAAQPSFTVHKITIVYSTTTSNISTSLGSDRMDLSLVPQVARTSTLSLVNVMGIEDPYADYPGYDLFWTTALDSADSASRYTCESLFYSRLSEFLSTELATGAISVGAPYTTFCVPLPRSEPTTTRCATSRHTFGTLPSVFPFQPSSPCCDKCSITAGDIQVYRWPPSSAGLSYSTLVNSNSFTL